MKSPDFPNFVFLGVKLTIVAKPQIHNNIPFWDGRGEICIRVNLSTGQWVYLYTVFSNFRVQNRGEICIHKRSKQEWNLYTKVEGKGCICILYFINLKDFFRVKAKVTFVYFCQISDEICILLVNRELVLWDEPNVRLG